MTNLVQKTEKLRPQVAKNFSKIFSEFSFQIYLILSTSHLLNSNLKKTFFSALAGLLICQNEMSVLNNLIQFQIISKTAFSKVNPSQSFLNMTNGLFHSKSKILHDWDKFNYFKTIVGAETETIIR